MSRKGKKWNEAELNIIREHYTEGGPRACMPYLPGRSQGAITIKANQYGIYAPAFLQEANKFKPGRPAWNKNKYYIPGGNSASTRWKPGNRHNKWKPIGTTIKQGPKRYLMRKVSDTGDPQADWRFVHHLVWIEHNGPIPEGGIVFFKNGNCDDITIENLGLTNRREMLERNSVHNLPEPIKEVIRAKARLVRVIGELSEKQTK